MRATIESFALAAAFFLQAPQTPSPSGFRAFAYDSQVLGLSRTYRVALPLSYAKSPDRYPVVYWFPSAAFQSDALDRKLAAYASAHNVILVDAGPGQPQGQLPMFLPELVAQVDGTLRTVADREHRALAGMGEGGFLALFLAGKYPDLIGSASTISGIPEADVGPDGFPAGYNHENFAANYEGVRVRMANSTADSLAFYHRRMTSIWAYTRPAYESASFLAGQDLAEIDRTLDFHMKAFSNPLPPAGIFNHVDAYPSFRVWGWEVESNRKQPGFTLLENVSNRGFRSSVRESLPGGSTIPEVSLSIGSAPIYPPGVALTVTYIRLSDGDVRRTEQRADSHGRLHFELSGDTYEVAVSNAALLTISGYSIDNANWATAGQPVTVRVRFWNKGSAPIGTSVIHWESPNPGVKLATPAGRLNSLAAGESATLPVTFTVEDPARAIVRLIASSGNVSMPVEVPFYPSASLLKEFQIADGRTLPVYRHANQKAELRFGEGNGDGHPAPGEMFAVLIPDGDALRAADLITNDSCLDSTIRGTDSWDEYDHSGASATFSVPSVRLDCEPGHVINALARVQIPHGAGTHYQYWTLEFPVWHRNEGK